MIPKGATHTDIDGDYWIITQIICFIWNSVRKLWVEYVSKDEVDMTMIIEIV